MLLLRFNPSPDGWLSLQGVPVQMAGTPESVASGLPVALHKLDLAGARKPFRPVSWAPGPPSESSCLDA